jgi:hypothetical protein
MQANEVQETADSSGSASPLLRCLFLAVGVGLNVTFAIYLAFINVYGHTVSRSVLGYQNLSIYICATMIVGVQMFYDEKIDKNFGSAVTYPCRVVLSLCVMGFTLLGMVMWAERVELIFVYGALIGLFEGSGLSAAQALAAACSGEMTKYVNTGATLAQVLPIGLSAVFQFAEHGRTFRSQLGFAGLPMLLCLLTSAAFVLAGRSGYFDSAFRNLDFAAADTALTPGRSGPSTGIRGWRKTKELWLSPDVLLASVVQALTWGATMALMPFLPYFGSLELAHNLVLVRFAGELFGRIVSLFSENIVGRRLCFAGRTMLLVLVANVACRVGLLVLLFAVLSGYIAVSTLHLYVIVAVFYALGGIANNEVMAVIVDMYPASESALARGMMFICFGSQLVSLAVTIPMVEFGSY